MKIIGSSTSPFVRKGRIVAALKGQPCEFVPEFQWAPESEVYRLNPLSKVPVLVLDDESAMFGSSLIAEYMDSLPSHALSVYPAESKPRFACKQVEVLADGVIDAGALYVQETWRAEGARSQVWRDRQMLKVTRGLAALEKSLNGRTHFFEQRVTIADVATLCTVDFLRFSLANDVDLKQWPSLSTLSVQLNALEAFATTQPVRMPNAKFPAL